MKTKINFYHLTSVPIGKALPRLMEKVVASGSRAVIKTSSSYESEELDKALWTYTTNVFLPHGKKGDKFESRQPIYITEVDENPNGADVIISVGISEIPDIEKYRTYLVVFDGGDSEQVKNAREKWRHLSKTNDNIEYWRQTDKGAWTQVGGRK